MEKVDGPGTQAKQGRPTWPRPSRVGSAVAVALLLAGCAAPVPQEAGGSLVGGEWPAVQVALLDGGGTPQGSRETASVDDASLSPGPKASPSQPEAPVGAPQSGTGTPAMTAYPSATMSAMPTSAPAQRTATDLRAATRLAPGPQWDLLPPRLLDDYAVAASLRMAANPGQALGVPPGALDSFASVWWRTDDPGGETIVVLAVLFADGEAARTWAGCGPQAVAVGRSAARVWHGMLDADEAVASLADGAAAAAGLLESFRHAAGPCEGPGAKWPEPEALAPIQGAAAEPGHAQKPAGDDTTLQTPSRMPSLFVDACHAVRAQAFWIELSDGRRFSPVSADFRCDPGTASYTTFEGTWTERGVPMRWYVYLHSDGQRWWADEMRVYDGSPGGEWLYVKPVGFEAMLGSPFEAASWQASANGAQGGQVSATLFAEGLSFQARFNSVTPSPALGRSSSSPPSPSPSPQVPGSSPPHAPAGCTERPRPSPSPGEPPREGLPPAETVVERTPVSGFTVRDYDSYRGPCADTIRFQAGADAFWLGTGAQSPSPARPSGGTITRTANTYLVEAGRISLSVDVGTAGFLELAQVRFHDGPYGLETYLVLVATQPGQGTGLQYTYAVDGRMVMGTSFGGTTFEAV